MNIAKVVLNLNLSEADLLMIEFQNAVDNGAEDGDFRKVLEKVKAARARTLARFAAREREAGRQQ